VPKMYMYYALLKRNRLVKIAAHSVYDIWLTRVF